MMKKISMYFTALCALWLVAACSTEEDKATDGPSDTASLIRIGAFPAFEQEADSRTIGTPDPGKTAWAEGDIVLLKLQLTYNDGTTEAPSRHTLTYSEATAGWTAAPALPDFIADYHYTTNLASIDVKAYYAPAYEWSTTSKSGLALISGKKAGTDEYLTYTDTYIQAGKPIRIDFSAARPYSRLRIATRPGIEVGLGAHAYFTPAGSDKPLGYTTFFATVTSDKNGNAFFFGSWLADTKISIRPGMGAGDNIILKTIAASQAAKSYAIDAPYYDEVEVDRGGGLKKALGDRVTTMTHLQLVGIINADDFKTMNTDMTALTHIDMSGVKIAGDAILPIAFLDNTRIKHITLPTSITQIGAAAFMNCSNWAGTLSIPEAVTVIANEAFRGCSSLTGNLTIPSRVTTIGHSAFLDCTGLSGTLTIPESVTEIGGKTFQGCTGLTGTLTIPNSVTAIGGNAFDGCSGFTGRLTIPTSVTTIQSYAFQNCTGFTAVTIPEGVTHLQYGAFTGCTGLNEQIVLPKSLTEIEADVFLDCTNIPSFKAQWVDADKIPTYWENMLGQDKPIHIPVGTKAAYVSKDWPADRLVETE